MKRPLILGERPGRGYSPVPIFGAGDSSSSRQLDRLMPDWREHYDGRNLWLYASGHTDVERRWAMLSRERPFVIALGTRVWEAIGGESDRDWFSFQWIGPGWGHYSGVTVVRFPHPSGLNRIWNDGRVREQAAAIMRAAL